MKILKALCSLLITIAVLLQLIRGLLAFYEGRYDEAAACFALGCLMWLLNSKEDKS